MTSDFREFVSLDEAYSGYILSSLMAEVSAWLNLDEGRINRGQLAGSDFTYKPRMDKTLFGDEEIGQDPAKKVSQFIDDEGGDTRQRGDTKDTCEITPLSGYSSHITAIQVYAKSSPENFAQVLMFSPLSANTPFAKHWDNFQMLMAILKHQFPKRVSAEQIEQAARAFDEKYHKLTHTLSGWKYDTIAHIWSNKEGLFQELHKLAGGGDDVALIKRLSMIKGVQPVKAGFMAQLLWGRAGCIDTHNIDIYSKVFPDMDAAGDFDERKWGAGKGASDKKRTAAAQKYVGVLDKLDKRGIGTKQLWDVWVEFVETMYIMITKHGKGYYDMQGGALDPKSPEYASMQGVEIPKLGIGKDRGGVMVPLAKGQLGRGASATHLQMDPDEALKQFHQLYRGGEIGEPASSSMSLQRQAARAVKFRIDPNTGKSVDQNLGKIPTALHYLEPAMTGGEVDPDHIRSIIRDRIAGKKKKEKAAAAAAARRDAASASQGVLFK